MINYNKLNTIYKTNSFIEANLIKGMLDNFNIPNFIEKEAIGKVFGITVDGLGEIKIKVPYNYRWRALKILNIFSRRQKMKIFLDTANVSEIKEATNLGVIDGVTTNPTLIAKEKGSTLTEIVKEIVSIIDGPVSVEVVSIKADDMVEEAKKLHSIAPSNIVIKVPICEEGLKAIKRLSKEGIKTNCTLIFSVNQGILAIKAGATYVSPFVGRIDDIGWEGMDVVRDLVIFIENYGFSTQVIASSIRHPLHVTQAAILGAHVATIPFSVLQKMVKHPLTDSGIEKFLKDWEEFSRSSKSGTLLS